MAAKAWIVIAGLLGAGAVTLGAYHAHGLEKLLIETLVPGPNDPEYIEKTSRHFRERFDANKNGRLSGAEIEAYISDLMHNCDVAVKYQMYHALAILGIGILAARRCTWSLSVAALLMLLGVLGFSGGLYFTVFDIAKLHWSIVPLGGLLMIVGWLVLAIAAFTIAVDGHDDQPKKA